jgi:monovalent cation:H+ antiporter-2, CPA2 family
MDIVPTLLIILVAAFIAGAIALRLGQPVILGFVVAGVALGPYTGGITVTELIDAESLAEVGVALLLFALGIEFSLSSLRPVSAMTLFGVPLQLLLTFIFGFVIGRLFGWQSGPAFWFATLIVLSSPIVTLHTLASLGVADTHAAHFSRGILIVQNLAVVAFLFVMRQLQAGVTDLPTLALATAEGIAFLTVLLFLGIYILPRLYSFIARQKGDELPLLAVIASAALVIYGTYLYGLSFVEVAFIIGLLLSESELGSRALKALMSLRDLFGVLFFVSTGMLLNLTYLAAHVLLVLGLVVTITLGKMLIIGGTSRLFGRGKNDSLFAALTLFQLSELSFVFASLTLKIGATSDQLYSLIIAVGLITMLLTPYLVRIMLRLKPQLAN